jgi:stearoyl-CoA desaturase (delta-9 desaturase)
VRIYNLSGYVILVLYLASCAYFAPPYLGSWAGLAISFIYLVTCWFVAGVYLADVLHLGVAHRALDYKPWFTKAITVVNNVFGVYVGPVSWVNRHRLHHKHSDHEGDPNKLSRDGLWRTLYLCMMPYECNENLANDPILKSRTFRLVDNTFFAVIVQMLTFVLLWRIIGDLRFVAVMWAGMRIFALWVNMIQNYWTHTRSYGYRRYDDDHDNAMNIGEWLPVTATFSACLQNNHHHYPSLLRLSHDDTEYDFGFTTVRWMKRLGLVEATPKGGAIPHDVPLAALNF